MTLTSRCPSPLGEILLAAEEEGLTGLWFVGQRYEAEGLPPEARSGENEPIRTALRWLEAYFGGAEPDFTPPLVLRGTPFQKRVWAALLTIPFGKTVTYGKLAAQVGTVSARAVGGAVGHNPVSLIVPCHRVVGADGSLTGYAGGVERKKALLTLEKRVLHERGDGLRHRLEPV